MRKNTNPLRTSLAQSLVVLSACVLCFSTHAQTLPVPRTGLDPSSPAAKEARGIFDAQHLADRPYSGVLPQPVFPSSKRVQRLFTVAYAYDYAYSMYTPAAALPIVGRAAAKFDTPEAAAIAYTSAARTGDLDALAAASDSAEQKALHADIANPALGPAKVKASIQQMFPGKTVELLARIEVMGYVILDIKASGSPLPYLPLTFKLDGSSWHFTNELAYSGSQFMANFQPDLGGVINPSQPQPVAALNSPNLEQLVQAQGVFLREHLNRNIVTEGGK